MKLPLQAIVVFLFLPGHWRIPLPVTAALCLRPQKKPALLAGFLYLRLNISPLTSLFLPTAPLSRSPRSLQLTIQTPSSL
jgi:hypothetical protein